MPYMNNDATLADVIGPAYVAQQAGLQNDTANQTEQVELQNKQATQAADQDKPYLGNLFTQGQLGQQAATTQAQNLANQKTAALQPSDIQAGVAKNQLTTSADQSQKLLQLGQIAGQAAAYLDSVPPPARQAAMSDLLQQNGVDPSRLGALASGDPDMLRNFSQKAIQAGGQFQTEQYKETSATNRAMGVAGIEAGSREKVAETNASARQYVADQKKQVDQMKVNIDQQIAALTQRIGSPSEQPGDKERLQFLADQQRQVKNMQAQTTRALLGLGNDGNPNAVPPTPELNIPSQGGGGQPTQPQAPANYKAAAQSAFGSYEPDKYEYGINPNTGNFGRRPKGK